MFKNGKKQKGSIIFRYGNKGNKFYIVLGGEVSVLILREKKVEFTSLNFMKYLFFLKVIKEDELAKKILNENPKSTFRISEKNLDKYYDNIISFINKYYKAVPVNETENENKNKSSQKISKINVLEMNEKQQNNNEQELPKGLYDYNNNFDFENKNKIKKADTFKQSNLKRFFKKYTLISLI